MDCFGLVVVFQHLSCRNAGFCFVCSELSILLVLNLMPQSFAQVSKLLSSSVSS